MNIRHNALEPRAFVAYTTTGAWLGSVQPVGEQLEVRAADDTITIVSSHRQAVDQLYFGTH